MASSPISNRIKDEIVALRRESVQVDAEKLLGIVRAVVDSMGNDLDCASLKVYAEIEDLAACIRAAREDISALCPSEITEKHLPTASDELDAIVESTERATNSIMEAAESIEALAADLRQRLIQDDVALRDHGQQFHLQIRVSPASVRWSMPISARAARSCAAVITSQPSAVGSETSICVSST